MDDGADGPTTIFMVAYRPRNNNGSLACIIWKTSHWLEIAEELRNDPASCARSYSARKSSSPVGRVNCVAGRPLFTRAGCGTGVKQAVRNLAAVLPGRRPGDTGPSRVQKLCSASSPKVELRWKENSVWGGQLGE